MDAELVNTLFQQAEALDTHGARWFRIVLWKSPRCGVQLVVWPMHLTPEQIAGMADDDDED